MYHHAELGPSALSGNKNFSARGRLRGAAHPTVNLGPPHILAPVRDRKLKFYTRIERSKYSCRAWKFFLLGACGGCSAPSVNCGPPHISETVRHRELKFYAFRQGQVHFLEIFPLGASQGCIAPTLNLGPLISLQLLELENWHFIHL